MGITWTHLESVWNPSGPSEVPYSMFPIKRTVFFTNVTVRLLNLILCNDKVLISILKYKYRVVCQCRIVRKPPETWRKPPRWTPESLTDHTVHTFAGARNSNQSQQSF